MTPPRIVDALDYLDDDLISDAAKCQTLSMDDHKLLRANYRARCFTLTALIMLIFFLVYINYIYRVDTKHNPQHFISIPDVQFNYVTVFYVVIILACMLFFLNVVCYIPYRLSYRISVIQYIRSINSIERKKTHCIELIPNSFLYRKHNSGEMIFFFQKKGVFFITRNGKSLYFLQNGKKIAATERRFSLRYNLITFEIK